MRAVLDFLLSALARAGSSLAFDRAQDPSGRDADSLPHALNDAVRGDAESRTFSDPFVRGW